MTTKKCIKCHQVLDITSFNKTACNKTGRENTCKTCRYERRRKNEGRTRRQYTKPSEQRAPNPRTEAHMVMVWRSNENPLMPWQVDVQGWHVARFPTHKQAVEAGHVMFEYLTDGITDRPLSGYGLSMNEKAVQKRAERARKMAA